MIPDGTHEHHPGEGYVPPNIWDFGRGYTPYGEPEAGDQPWDTDYGDAVLAGYDEAEVLASAAHDALWELEQRALAATGVDDTPPPVVPGAAELDIRGTLSAADVTIRLERLQQTMYEQPSTLPDRHRPEDSIGFQDCELEHAALESQYLAASKVLVEAMEGAYKINAGIFVHYSSRHIGSFMLPDNAVVPVYRTVSVYLDPQGHLCDYSAGSGLEVRTETGYGSARVLHNLVPLETTDRRRISGTQTVSHAETGVRPIAYEMDNLAGPIREAAQRAAVQPWIEAYLALPKSSEPPQPDDGYGFQDLPQSFRMLLSGEAADSEAAAVRLGNTFRPESQATLSRILQTPVAQVVDRLKAAGVAERYEWLMTHAHAIQADILAAERHALDAALRPAYEAWRQVKAENIRRFATLAEELKGMPAEPFSRPLPPGIPMNPLRRTQLFFKDIFRAD